MRSVCWFVALRSQLRRSRNSRRGRGRKKLVNHHAWHTERDFLEASSAHTPRAWLTLPSPPTLRTRLRLADEPTFGEARCSTDLGSGCRLVKALKSVRRLNSPSGAQQPGSQSTFLPTSAFVAVEHPACFTLWPTVARLLLQGHRLSAWIRPERCDCGPKRSWSSPLTKAGAAELGEVWGWQFYHSSERASVLFRFACEFEVKSFSFWRSK